MVEMGQGIIEAILTEHPQLKIAGTIETATITTTIHLPGGVQRQYQATDIGFGFEALDAKEGDLLWLSDSLHVAGGQFDPMKIARNIKEQARMAAQNSRITAGKYPVIFTPQALPALWEAFKAGAEWQDGAKGSLAAERSDRGGNLWHQLNPDR